MKNRKYGILTLFLTLIFVFGFVKKLSAPTAQTDPATSITNSEATLNGLVNPGNEITDVQFEYGTASDLTGSTTTAATESPLAAGTSDEPVTLGLSSLSAETQYYYRVEADNPTSGGTFVEGSILSFHTLDDPPASAVASLTATPTSQTTINLSWADLSDEEGYLILANTSGTFTDPTNGAAVPSDDLGISGGAVASVAAGSTSFSGFTGFAANTRYYFKIYAYRLNAISEANYAAGTAGDTYTWATGPSGNPSGMGITIISDSQLDLDWTDGSSGEDGYLLLGSTSSISDPSDGTAIPSDDLDFAGGTISVDLAADANSYSAATGLTADTRYYFKVLSYTLNGNGLATYSNSEGGDDYTFDSKPAGATSFTATASATDDINLTWADAADEDGYLILVNTSGAFTDPTDGVSISNDTGVGGGGAINLSAGTTSYSGFTGLNTNTQYYYKIFSFSENTPGDKNYTSSPDTDDAFTFETQPSNPGSLTATAVGNDQIDVDWSNVGGEDGYLLLANLTGTFTDPVDGVSQTDDTDLSDGSAIVNTVTDDVTHSFTGLTASTQYFFKVFSYSLNSDTPVRPNYNTTGRSGNATTNCVAPSLQPTGIGFSGVNAGSITISWTDDASADGALVVLERDNFPAFAPDPGMDYAGEVNSDFSLADDQGSGARIVYRGSGETVVVTELEPDKTYYAEIWAYKNVDNCYLLTTPLSGSQLTTSVDSDGIIKDGSGAATIASTADTEIEEVDVFTFTVEDSGPDGESIDITSITFTQGTGNEVANWQNAIAGARLLGDDPANDYSEQSGLDIQPTSITIDIEDSHGKLGHVHANTSKDFTLKIYLKSDLGSTLKSTIDGLHFVFEVTESNVSTDPGDTQLTPGINTNSDADAGTNNEVTVDLTQLVFTTEPVPTTIFAGDNFSTPAVAEAQDINENRDLDYTGNNGVLFNVDRLDGFGTANEPASFNNGELIFPGNFTLTDPTATTTKIRVLDISGAGASTAQSVDIDVNTSNQSTIVASTTGFSYPQNIPYEIAANQGGTVLGTSVKVMQLEIRDGGALFNDADNLGTELTAITLGLTDPNGVVNQVALFDDTNTLIDQQAAAGSIVFGSIGSAATTAADDGFKRISVRVTFNSTVTDNSQFYFTVTSATANPSTSIFAAGDAGGAQSPTTGPDNQIEVTATQFVYSQQPSPYIRLGIDFTTQGKNIPALQALDPLNNLDVDYGNGVTPAATITNTDNINMSTTSIPWNAGGLTFPGSFTYTTFTGSDPGNGTLTVTVGGISKASDPVIVDGTAPTVNVTSVETGAGLLNDGITKDGNSIAFTVTFTELDEMDETPPPRISIDGAGNLIDAALVKTNNLVWTYNWSVVGGLNENVTVTITGFDRSGNPVGTQTGTLNWEIDNTAPTLDDVTIFSNSTDPAYTSDPLFAKVGDVITLTFTADDDLEALPVVTIDTKAATESGTPALYTATYTATTGDTQGAPLGFTIDFTDAAGNVGTTITSVSGTGAGTSVTFDETKPLLTSLVPDNNFLAVPVDAPLTITLDDDLIANINGSGNFRIKEFVGDADFTTFTVSFLSNTVTLTPTSNFAAGIEYYVEIDGVTAGAGGNAIYDKAGNPYDGFVDNTTWKFQTFKTAEVSDIVGNADNSICVSDFVTITGKYFGGYSSSAPGPPTKAVTQVDFREVSSGTLFPVTGTDIVIVSDTEISVKVPPGIDEDVEVVITKAQEVTPIGTNILTVSSLPTDVVSVGPSTADIQLADPPDRDVVCSQGISTTNFEVIIFGGLPPYTLTYEINGVPATPIAGYQSGDDVLADPPNEGINVYEVTSVVDDNGCSVPVFPIPTINIEQINKSDVTISSVTNPLNPVCLVGLNTGDEITISGTLTGTNNQVRWTSVNGTGDFTENPGNNFVIQSRGPGDVIEVNYKITAQDIALDFLEIKAESYLSTAPCLEDSDIIQISFTTSQSANLGGNKDICKTVANPTVDLVGVLGGGATNGSWLAIGIGSGGTVGGDGTFGTETIGGSGELLRSYTMSDDDVFNGGVQIQLTPGGGSCGTPLSDLITVSLQDLPIPQITGTPENTSVCVNTTFVEYTIGITPDNTNSSFAWSIVPGDASLPSEVGTIKAGQGTHNLFISWHDKDAIHDVQVIETNEFGCISVESTLAVTVNPNPVVSFVQPLPGVRDFSKDGANQLLIGNPAEGTGSNDEGWFIGPGVISDEFGAFFFDPDVAGSGSTHDITYNYTDDLGCTGSLTEQFSVFDASASVVLFDGDSDPNNDIVLADEYCEDYGVLQITISPTFPNAAGFEFDEFTGPGITDNGDGTAYYDPLFAADATGTGANRVGGPKIIEYTQHEIGNETNIIPWGSQITDVNLIPPLANDPLPQSLVNRTPASAVYCSNDAPFIMTRDQALNPLASFSFFVIDEDGDAYDPHGLITQGAGPTFTLNPFNEFHPDSSYYDPTDFTAHVVTIRYSYEFFYQPNDDDPGTMLSCNDVTDFNVTIYQRPPAPTSDPVFGCEEGATVPDLEVINPVPGATVRWYDNPNLSGTPVQGATFDSNVTALGTTNFYVTQEINGCESLPTTVPVTITTVNESDVSFTTGPACEGQDTQFTSAYAADPLVGGTIVAWAWDFGDPDAIGNSDVSTLENPSYAFSVPRDYNVSLTVTNDGGCEATVIQVVTVGEIPEPSFTFTAIAAEKPSVFQNTTPAITNSAVSEVKWRFEEWDGTLLHEETITDPEIIAANLPFNYTFTTAGRKRASLTISTDRDCFATSEAAEFFIVPFVEVTDVMYDFNSSTEGWISWGFDNPNSEWELGAPTGLFNDGVDRGQVWYTNPNSDDEDFSIVYSPCFDISTLIRPELSMNTFTDTQDGVIIQYTTDFINWTTLGRQASGIEWYNVELIPDLQQFPDNEQGVGWRNTEAKEWRESKHSLSDITDADQVILRVVYRGISPEPGFAFDNFRIKDRDRVVLLEHFENSIASTDLETINAFGKPDPEGELNTLELVKIQYRTGFGGEDEIYRTNQSDANARALFYDITRANRAVMDGDDTETGLFSTWGAREFGTKSLTDPELEFVDVSISQNPGNGQLDFSIKMKATLNDLPEFVTHVAIVEKSFMGEEYVMRKMVPDASGTVIPELKLSTGEITLPIITWEKPIDSDNLSAIIFAQEITEDGLNEVFQAKIVDIDFNVITALNNQLDDRDLLLYPNPASEMLNVMFRTFEKKTLRVFDQFGKMVYDKDLDQGVKSHQIETARLASGVYFLQVESTENELIREKFILSH